MLVDYNFKASKPTKKYLLVVNEEERFEDISRITTYFENDEYKQKMQLTNTEYYQFKELVISRAIEGFLRSKYEEKHEWLLKFFTKDEIETIWNEIVDINIDLKQYFEELIKNS